MADLLLPFDLPGDFGYPPAFIRVVELGLTSLEPWWVLEGEILRDRYLGLMDRYPTRHLVPFARRQDNDDVACWDVSSGRVSVIHDFASAGFEQREEYPDFYAWLRQAIEDLIAFD